MIEREFYNYRENKKRATEYVATSAFKGLGVDYSAPRVIISSTNGVEKRMIRMVAEEERLYRWCLVFEKTMNHFFGEQKDELMRRRYIEREKDLETCFAIGIERRTYYYWVNDILNIARRWAKEYNLL